MYLIFDSYGTLMEMDNFYGRLQLGFKKLGVSLPLDVVRRAAHAEMRHYMKGARFANCLDSWNKLRRDCAQILENAIREQGYKIELPAERVLNVLSEAVVYKPFDDIKSSLEHLRAKGVRLGVLSNWDFKLQAALDDAGIAHLFDFVLSSAQVGIEKPAREFFERGLALARKAMPDLKARDCFYVGDHYEKDVVGARNAGLNPIWLVRDKRDLPSGDTHEAQDDVPRLRSLRDLLPLF